jgi:hypothetical protein
LQTNTQLRRLQNLKHTNIWRIPTKRSSIYREYWLRFWILLQRADNKNEELGKAWQCLQGRLYVLEGPRVKSTPWSLKIEDMSDNWFSSFFSQCLTNMGNILTSKLWRKINTWKLKFRTPNNLACQGKTNNKQTIEPLRESLREGHV